MKLYLGLAGPLLLFVYIPLALIGLAVLSTKFKPWKTRAWAIPLYLILAYAIPLGDVTWHSWNMSKVCPKAGLHVYRTVVVDGFFGEYASMDTMKKHPYMFLETEESPGIPGYIRLERNNGAIVVLHREPKITAEWEIVQDRLSFPDKSLGVTISRVIVRNRLSGEVIAEYQSFTAWRGWIDALIASVIDNSVGVCYQTPKMITKFSEILIPSGGTK